jgi:hypothetical protein
MYGLQKQTTFKADFSASQWDLYTSAMDCNEVARKLNSVLTELLNLGIPREEVEKKMCAYMDRFAEYGACDSEPMHLLDRVLDEVFNDE